jgi:hypothetical protein
VNVELKSIALDIIAQKIPDIGMSMIRDSCCGGKPVIFANRQ